MWMVLCFLVGIVTVLTWLLSSPFYWRTRNVQHLIPLPIIGNCISFLVGGNIGFSKYLYNKFPGKKYFGFHFFNKPALFVNDPELIYKMKVTDFSHFNTHGLHNNQEQDPYGCSVILTHGQQWTQLREILSSCYTPAKSKSVLLNSAENTIPKMINIIDENMLKNQPIDMLDLMRKVTTDINGQTIFGVETDTFTNNNSNFNVIAAEVSGFLYNFRILFGIISPKLYDLLGFSLFANEYVEFVRNIIVKTMHYRKTENIRRQDVLQNMMELMETKQYSEEKYFPDNTPVTRFNLNTTISQCMFLYIASVEGVALTMSFCLYELALHPDIQDKCRDEILSKIKENGSTKVTADFANQLTYLTAVVKETLRLHPPVTVLSSACSKDYKLPGSDLTIEKGTLIYAPASTIQRDERYFPEANIFRPERFLSGEQSICSGSYFPFGIGPRICLGAAYAKIEMNVILSRLLQNYKFTVCSRTTIPMKYATYPFLTTPTNGIWLAVQSVQTAE